MDIVIHFRAGISDTVTRLTHRIHTLLEHVLVCYITHNIRHILYHRELYLTLSLIVRRQVYNVFLAPMINILAVTRFSYPDWTF